MHQSPDPELMAYTGIRFGVPAPSAGTAPAPSAGAAPSPAPSTGAVLMTPPQPVTGTASTHDRSSEAPGSADQRQIRRKAAADKLLELRKSSERAVQTARMKATQPMRSPELKVLDQEPSIRVHQAVPVAVPRAHTIQPSPLTAACARIRGLMASSSPVTSPPQRVSFDAIDTNGDGVIDRAEWEQFESDQLVHQQLQGITDRLQASVHNLESDWLPSVSPLQTTNQPTPVCDLTAPSDSLSHLTSPLLIAELEKRRSKTVPVVPRTADMLSRGRDTALQRPISPDTSDRLHKLKSSYYKDISDPSLEPPSDRVKTILRELGRDDLA